MAEAKRKVRKPTEEDVELTLTYEEAQALLDVTESIGGDTSKTRRGIFDDIRLALVGVGVEATNQKDMAPGKSLYFLQT